MQYNGMYSIVNLKSFPLNDSDSSRYYTLDNGEIRPPYVDIKDGMPKCALPALTAYSSEKGCGQVALAIADIYIAEYFDSNRLSELSAEDIYSVYCLNNAVWYNDKSLNFGGIYKGEGIEYSLREF